MVPVVVADDPGGGPAVPGRGAGAGLGRAAPSAEDAPGAPDAARTPHAAPWPDSTRNIIWQLDKFHGACLTSTRVVAPILAAIDRVDPSPATSRRDTFISVAHRWAGSRRYKSVTMPIDKVMSGTRWS